MNNTWNRLIYKAWAPFYNIIFNKGMFQRARRTIFQPQLFSSSQRVLYVGVGTGADLAFLPPDPKTMQVMAIDYSEDMLRQARKHYGHRNIAFRQMDAQDLRFEDGSFDTIVASLILSVVPDPRRTFQEMVRVLDKGGQLIIFDKFAPRNKALSPLKKLIRPIISLAGTDIGLSFENLLLNSCTQVEVLKDENILMGGMYRVILIRN